jgi:pimeloyl-ACP methyl ester carboxylesterase
LAELLDKLDLDRVAVAGGSAGAQAALQFALRHPTRCDALILIVPATYVPGRAPVALSALQEFIIQRALYSDFVFWAARNIMPIQLVRTLLATDQAVLEGATPSERARAFRILDELMPVSQRSRGMFNDAKLAGNPAPVDVSELRVPVLIISVEDDRFGTAAAARHLAQEIKGSKLVLYSSGGHIWLGHDEDLAAEVHAFLTSLQ